MWWLCMVALGAEPVTMDLDEARQRLVQDAPTLQVLEGRVAEARAQARLSTAPLLPVVAARGGYVRNNEEAVVSIASVMENLANSLPIPVDLDPTGLPDDLIIQPLEQWTAGVDAKVPLVQPSAWANHAAARAGVDAAEAQAAAARREADAGLVRAAWMASAAEQVADARARGVASAEAHRDSAQRRLAAGIGTELDVLQAETELARRQSDHAQAVADRDAARRAMGALLGMDGGVRIEVGDLPPLSEGVRAESHPELVAAEAKTHAARRQQSAAWLQHAPTLDAVGSIVTSDVPFPTGLTTGWKVGVQATWVLFDGGARYGMAGVAHAKRQQAEAGVETVRLDLIRREADADQGVTVAEERLRLAERALATATRAEATAGRLFENGLADALQTLDAQQRRIDADVARAGAEARLAVARVDLALVVGP
jgi:outer membrane protein TolC